MTAKDLDNLCDMLRDAREFARVQEAFFDLSDDPSFFNAGKVWEDEILETAIEACVSSMLHKKPTSVTTRLVRIDQFGFVHGSLLTEGAMGSVLYFEKTQMGLVALSDMTENALFARFTTSRPSSGVSLN